MELRKWPRRRKWGLGSGEAEPPHVSRLGESEQAVRSGSDLLVRPTRAQMQPTVELTNHATLTKTI